MRDDFCLMDTWRAKLNTGEQYEEDSPELSDVDCSPFRKLQQMGNIDFIEIELGFRKVSFSSDGFPLVTGQAIDLLMPLGNVDDRHSTRYRWICRQEEGHWLWRITDGISVWEVETKPGIVGKECMPRPIVRR